MTEVEPYRFHCPCGDPLLEPLQHLLEPCLSRARDGRLTKAEAEELASGQLAWRLLPEATNAEQTNAAPALRDLLHAATLSRALYQRTVSWFLFSEEWLDGLASLLLARGRSRVLEVGAGAGCLAVPMLRRGLNWRTTDVRPSVGQGRPEQCDALTALSRFGDEVDAVFWAWWVRGDEGDAALAEECARWRLPAIFVGESRGGCTGSVALWERTAPARPLLTGSDADAPRLEWDVPTWPDVQDRTWVVDMSFL